MLRCSRIKHKIGIKKKYLFLAKNIEKIINGKYQKSKISRKI